MMSHRIIYAVILIFAAVAILIMVCDEGVISPEADRYSKSKVRILDLDPEAIYKFLFITEDSTLIEIERDLEGWTIKQPIQTEGSDYSIPNLVEGLTSSITVESIEAVEDLRKFGLADPRVIIIVFSKGRSSPDTILVGDKAPTRAMCYARRSSSRNVLLTNEITNEILEKTLFHLRDKKLIKLDVFKSETISFSSAAKSFRLEKEAGEWFLKGTDFKVRKRFVDDYLKSLHEALIYRFVSEGKSGLNDYGLEDPAYTITMQSDKDSLRLSFGKRVSDMIMAARSDAGGVFLVRSDILDIFAHPVPDFIDLRLTALETESISSISLLLGPSEVNLLRNEYGWIKIDSLGSGSVDAEYVKEIIAQLNSFRFNEYPLRDLEAFKSEKAQEIEITIRAEQDNRLEKIFFFAGAPDSILAGSLSAQAAGRVDRADYLRLKRRLRDL